MCIGKGGHNEKLKRNCIISFEVVYFSSFYYRDSLCCFSFSKSGSQFNIITTAKIFMSYNEGENGISIVDALFMEDSVGMCLFGSGQVFDFMVVAFIFRMIT